MGSLPAVDEPIIYPSARRDESIFDDYHGVAVGDPYRWLEDPDSDETKEFVKAQVDLSEGVLATCDLRGRLRTRITELLDHPRHYVPSKRAGKYFYLSNSGLQAQSVLYVQGEADGRAEVLLDPNELSKDGTVALRPYSVSQDGRYLAYGLSSSGSDWVTIRVMPVEEKVPMMDTLRWIKFSGISWTQDGKGFFYSRFPAPREPGDAGTETNINLNHQVYYHFLGTDQSEDILCWSDSEHPRYIFEARVTDDGKYCLLYIEEGCDSVNQLYYCDLTSLPEGIKGFKRTGMLPFTKLVDRFEACYTYVANDDTKFTFVTNKEAPKNKVVRVDLKDPKVWTDVVVESKKDVLEIVRAGNGDKMMVCYMNDVKHTLQVRDLESGRMLHQLPLDIGSISGVTGNRYDTEVLVGFTSFLTPGIIFKCDLSTEVPEMKIFKEISLPGFDREDFEVKQVFISSKDDTKVPMFIFAKRNTPMDGSNPTLLYGYGGFNVSLTPTFSVNRIVLARHLGVVFCIANIRGGGEYGREWHKSGTLSKKQNCFDDFISAAEYLVSSGYTNPRKLCIEGGSNGGLLVAACMNQRPDLFGCVLAHVGVMDMLRFHKFTIGHAWTTDFGCSDKEEEFHWLVKYSPLHNVKRPWERRTLPLKNCQYPSIILLTADHDDRVVPLHSLKMLATMQYVLCTSVKDGRQTNPIIARIDSKAGHGCGRSTQKMINEAADRYGFMAKIMQLYWIV